MNSGDLTKIARWIIPGWLAILGFIAFVFTDAFFNTTNTQQLYVPFLELFKSSDSPISSFLLAIFATASGVPIGFSIYQLYFYIRWNSPFSRDGLLPPVFPGRRDELKEIFKEIDERDLTINERGWRMNWIKHPFYEFDHGYKSRYQDLLFLEIIQKIDTTFDSVKIYSRYQYLHEIMHTLGASLLAIYLSFAFYLIVKSVNKKDFFVDYLLITTILTGIFFFLFNYEYHKIGIAKKNKMIPGSNDFIATFSFRSRFVNVDFVSPAEIFVVALALVHLWANPRLISNSTMLVDVIMRYAISVIMISTWMFSKKQSVKAMLGDGLSLGFSLFVSSVIISRNSGFTNWVDWSLFSAIFLFILCNMILLNNRKNTKEQSYDLQYYTMRRVLTEKQDKKK